MSPLRQYIQKQQDVALRLSVVLEALQILNNAKVAPEAATGMINVAIDMALDLQRNLDCVSLPKDEA